MQKRLGFVTMLASLIFSVFSLAVLPTEAFGQDQKETRVANKKWEDVMSFYSTTRLKYLAPILFQSLEAADSDEAIIADYRAFLDTFKYMSKVGGKEYDRMIEKRVQTLLANNRRLQDEDMNFFRSESKKLNHDIEKIFGKATRAEERAARDMLVGGDISFRFIDRFHKDDPKQATTAKLIFTVNIRPTIKTVPIKQSPQSKKYMM